MKQKTFYIIQFTLACIAILCSIGTMILVYKTSQLHNRIREINSIKERELIRKQEYLRKRSMEVKVNDNL